MRSFKTCFTACVAAAALTTTGAQAVASDYTPTAGSVNILADKTDAVPTPNNSPTGVQATPVQENPLPLPFPIPPNLLPIAAAAGVSVVLAIVITVAVLAAKKKEQGDDPSGPKPSKKKCAELKEKTDKASLRQGAESETGIQEGSEPAKFVAPEEERQEYLDVTNYYRRCVPEAPKQGIGAVKLDPVLNARARLPRSGWPGTTKKLTTTHSPHEAARTCTNCLMPRIKRKVSLMRTRQ